MTNNLIAPNGKPSNLNAEQYALVRTPEFKSWFGDWENDPENSSKVVDDNGEPLVVYHGAEIFNKNEKGLFYIFRAGSYFTDTYKSAEYYAYKLAYGITDVKKEDTEIYSVFLNIKNPKTFDYTKDDAEDYFHDFDQYDERIDTYLSEGYDGIFWEYTFKMYETSIKNKEKHFISFNPNQIKLADGSNTTFDAENPDIRYADGGAVQVPSTEDLIQLVVKERENKIRDWYRMRYKVVVARNDGYSYKKESERDSEFIDAKNPSRKKVLDIINSNPDLEEIRFNGTIKVGNRVGEGLEIADDFSVLLWKKENSYAKGGLSKTPAPKKDRVFGSDKNKVGSAASKESAKKINLSDGIINTLSNKAKEYNEENSGNKVTLNTLKAVMRRGMGAYSTSHRPTITGGAPNSRQAWGFARVNKFLKKKSGEKVKAAYVQDDDLLESGAILNLSCKDYISENEAVLKTGYYLDLREFSSINDPYGKIPLNLKHTLVTYNSGNQDGLSLIDTINPISLQKELAEILNIPMSNAHVVVGLYIKMAKKLKSVSDIKSDNIIVMDRDRLVCKSDAGDLFRMGGDINKNNFKMIQQHYQSMKPIGEIQVGDIYLIKEDMFAPHQDHELPQHLSTRYATVEVKSPCHQNLDAYVLEVMDCDCDHAAGKYAKGKIIERSRKHILSSGKLKHAVAKNEPTEFKHGGELDADSQEVKEYFAHDSGNAGGLLVGKRHSEGGIKADVKSTGQRIEMEGGEAVITRGAVNSKKKYVYEGKDMTTREILSDLNVKGGGVAFADGGDVPEKINCGCSSMKVGGVSYTPQDFITLSEKEYQEHRLIDGIEKERNDHFYTLAKLNSGAISIEQALREIASKEMMIDPKYPYSE
jgi:hypothetical protein